MLTKLIVAIVLTVITAFIPQTSSYAVWVFFIAVIVAFVIEGVRIVPQQHAFVVERLGKYHATLEPGLNLIIPFLDRVGYQHSLKEVPLDVPEQVCITKDNTQLTVDGILYFQVTDPMRASYGASNYVVAITQLAQTTLRSVIGRMELDRTFEERDVINSSVVQALDDLSKSPFSNCVMGLDKCNDKNPCPLHPVWVAAKDQMLSQLSTSTIPDIVKIGRAHV